MQYARVHEVYGRDEIDARVFACGHGEYRTDSQDLKGLSGLRLEDDQDRRVQPDVVYRVPQGVGLVHGAIVRFIR